MLRVIILLKDDVGRVETIILQDLLELILQNLEIEVPIHPTINLASKANSLIGRPISCSHVLSKTPKSYSPTS